MERHLEDIATQGVGIAVHGRWGRFRWNQAEEGGGYRIMSSIVEIHLKMRAFVKLKKPYA